MDSKKIHCNFGTTSPDRLVVSFVVLYILFSYSQKSRDNNIKIKAPTLVLWGNKGKLEQWYEPLSIWQNYCSSDLRGNAINSGHYLAEENPDEIIKNVKIF